MMPSSRLLHLVFSPAAANMASIKMWPLRRTIHVAARTSNLPKIQQLQFDIEGVISVVGGKMVAADMRFTRDSFDYWRNAAIPSNSIVKELASTWANMDSNMPFRLYAERTIGKKMEDFLQRMVVDVEQRITEEEFNPLEGRRLDVRLVDERELMAKEDINPDSKQDFNGRLDVNESAGEQESMAQMVEESEAKPGCYGSIDAQFADEEGVMAKEGKPESEQGCDKRSGLREFMVEEEKVEEVSRKLDVQLAGKHELVAKEEKVNDKKEFDRRLDVQESVVEEQKSEAMRGLNRSAKAPSANEQEIMEKVKKSVSQQGAQAQMEDATNTHVKKKESEREKKPEASHRILERESANAQKALEKEKKSEATQNRICEKEGVETQNTEARKQKYGVIKDHPYQQTDNIIQETRRIGKKVVHIYYDKGSARRESARRVSL